LICLSLFFLNVNGSHRLSYIDSRPTELATRSPVGRPREGDSSERTAQKDLPFIFERFYRGEKSRSREHGGAGIGLAIVKELVEAHDGHVGAEISGNETRIWFSLPT